MERFFFFKIMARYGVVCNSQSRVTSFYVSTTKLPCLLGPLLSV